MDKETLKRFTVQTVINPATIHAIEFEDEFEEGTKASLSAGLVQKFQNLGEIYIGQIVAVKLKNNYLRGIISEKFSKNLVHIFSVWLISNGTYVEVPSASVFLIKSELTDQKSKVYEITLPDIQPTTIELVISSVNLDSEVELNPQKSIFRKRYAQNWSHVACKFAADVLKANRCIYVKIIEINELKITGDIYYSQEGDTKLKSLAEALYEKDFAVPAQKNSLISPLDDCVGDDLNIEKRIPAASEKVEWDDDSDVKADPKTEIPDAHSGSNSSSSESDSSSYASCDKFSKLSDDKEQENPTLSPSWIIKKVCRISEPSSSEPRPRESEQAKQSTEEEEMPKVCLFNAIKRSPQLL